MKKKTVDKTIEYNGKSYTPKTLAKKLKLKSEIELNTGETWFSRAMAELDKKDKK